MIIEYKYYPDDSEAIKEALKVNFQIDYIMFCIDFEVTKAYEGTLLDPPEPMELIVNSQEIMYCTTVREPEIPIMLSKEQKFIIGDFVDYEELDEACWDAWKEQKESDDQDHAEYLYDLKHDR